MVVLGACGMYVAFCLLCHAIGLTVLLRNL